MISSGDQQEKSNVFCMYRGITGITGRTQREKVVNSLVYRQDFSSRSVFAAFAGSSGDRTHTEVNCQIVVSGFIT